jgi:DNA-binding PadR family transcriptional regulator
MKILYTILLWHIGVLMSISRIEMVLLGMIALNPSYAYEIDQFIQETHMRRWLRIGSASVYQGLERLAKKGLAYSRSEQEGRMPPRRRYYINEKGREALAKGAKTLLSHCEDHYLDLNLGIFCSHVLPEEEVPDLLHDRLVEVSAKCRDIKAHHRKVSKDKIWQQDAILDILVGFCQTEKQLLKKMTGQLQKKQG